MDVKTAKVYRIAAGALILGGVLGVVANALSPNGSTTSQVASTLYVPVYCAELVAGFLTVGAFTATYVRQWPRIGSLGLAGLALTLLGGLTAAITGPFFALFAVPWMVSVNHAAADAGPSGAALGAYFIGSGAVLALGAVLFGIATFRAGVLPRWSGVAFAALFVLGSVLVTVGESSFLGTLAGIAFFLALGLMGVALWQSSAEAAPEAIPSAHAAGASLV